MNPTGDPIGDRSATATRTEALFAGLLGDGYRRADRLFAVLLMLQWAAALGAALFASPSAWEGEFSRPHIHVWAAWFLGGAIVSLPFVLTLSRPGEAVTRHAVAAGQMLMGALLIHLGGGRIEAHFHVFGSLAFLALYRDWRVLATASLVVAADHYLRGVFWPRSVFGVLTSSPWRWVEHVGWVAFEDVVLVYGCLQSRRELHELARRQAEAEAHGALVEGEVERRTAELRQSNEGLAREIIERGRVTEELRRGESTLRSFFDNTPAMMGVVELREDDILYVSANVATATFFGLPPEAMAGRLASGLRLPRRYRGEWAARYRESRETGRPVRFEFAYREGGGTRHLSATLCHIPEAAGAEPRYSYVVEDVTAQRRAASAQAAQHAAARVLAGAADLDEAIAGVLRELGECLGMDVGEYWELDGRDGRLKPGAGWWARPGVGSEFSDASRRATFARGEGLPGRVWDTGRPAWIEDVARDGGFARSGPAAEAGLRGAFGFPVAGDVGPVGVISFLARRTLAADEPSAEVLATLGRQIGLFVARRRAEEALRLAHDDLERRVRERTAELDETNATLRRSEQRFRSLADAMPQIVWTCRPDGTPDYFNRRWYEFTGLPEGEVDDANRESILHPDDASRAREAWSESVRAGRPYQMEYRFLEHRTGTYRWQLGRALPVLGRDGRVVQWVGTCTDIDDRKRAEQLLRAAREELEDRVRERTAELRKQAQLIDLADDAIVVRSRDGMISSWNQGAERMYGWSREEASGRPSHELLKTVFPIPLSEIEGELARSGSWGGELIHGRRDGTTIVVASRWVLDRDGVEDRAILEINSNVTERKAAEDAMRRAKEAAEAATRSKSEFLANMSHEIRTPMNGILGMTELALETDLSPRQREYLGLVKSSADSLLTVINDILDFSKIEAGKLELSPAPFQFRDVVEETVRTLALRAHAKGLELACRIAPDVPDGLLGDSGRLRQVIVNLLGNAIKFTEEGEILLQAEVREGGGEGEVDVHLSVADTGVGIPAEKLASIFEPFEQADNSTTRRYGGTGLGLAISGKLVGMMGGRIWVESRVGGGSTFHFTSRLRRRAEGRATGGRRAAASFEGTRVLVVDDNATNRRILVEVLTNWGALPVAVDGGRAALDELRRSVELGRPFAAAVLDKMMPGMDGRELAERVRAEPGFSGVALILMSSDGSTVGAPDGDRAVFDACLSKPLRQSELYDTLAGVLGTATVASASAPGPEDGEDRPRKRPPTEDRRPAMRVLLAEDHPVNQKLAARVLEGAGHHVTIVGDGRKALDAIRGAEFDVVLMDVQMPVMDGFESLACIRALADPSKSRIPIIALTAHAMKGDRERCLDAGFDGYLSKPVRADALREAIDGLSPVARAPEAWDVRLIDGVVGRCGGDVEFARELLGAFVETAPVSSSGIESALRTGEAARLASEAHGLKGACLTIGADALAGSCARLEAAGRGDSMEVAGEESRAVLGGLARLSASIEAYLRTTP